MNRDLVLLEIGDGIATLTVNRPEKYNALNHQVLSEFGRALEAALADDSARTLIITGAGDKAFIAGADIGDLHRLDPFSAREYTQSGQRLLARLEHSEKPVIAAINGLALGGGCELAMACHIRYASDQAKLGQPEVGLGIIAGFMGTQRLPRLVGKGHGLEMLLTGGMISAHRAYEIGLVNKLCAADELITECRRLASTIISRGPLAIRYTLEAVQTGMEMGAETGGRLESALFGVCCASEDMREGTAAFLAGRPPVFKNR